jgi:N-acetylneuraminic acid mutarotase
VRFAVELFAPGTKSFPVRFLTVFCLRLLMLIGAGGAVLPLRSAPAAGWERRASLPVGNGGFVAAAIEGKIVIAGGTTWQGESKRWLDEIWAYDPMADRWDAAGRLPTALAYPATGNVGGQLWWAGGSGGGAALPGLWHIGPSLRPERVAAAGEGRVYSVGGIVGSRLLVVGGTGDQAAIDRIGSEFRGIDLATGAVTALPPYPEASLTTAAAVALGERLFVFGGARWDAAAKTVVNHAAAHVYDVTAGRWRALPPLPHPGRGLAAVALDERRILLAGGYRDDAVEFVADAFVFDVATATYVPAPPLPYAAMVTLVRDGEWLYCLGGEDRKRHRTDAVHRVVWRSWLGR